MNITSLEKSGQPEYKFQYDVKEKQDEFGLNWLDYGQRMYDSQIGRFHRIDRFADSLNNFSPYHYAVDNPIFFIDVNGDSVDVSNLNKEEFKLYNEQITKLSQNKLFKEYYNQLVNSKTTYIIKSGSGEGSTGSFNPTANEVHAVFRQTKVLAQELFHAFQHDLGVYTNADYSVRETEGDIVSSTIALSINEVGGSPSWDQGIRFKYTDDDLIFDKSVLSEEFDKDFNNAVDTRIQFYKKQDKIITYHNE